MIWKPKASFGLPSERNKCGFPTIIYRTPSNLVKECEVAFDSGLVLAALSLVVTTPDVCARLEGTMDYREWSKDYIGLSYDGQKMKVARKKTKTAKEVAEGFSAIEERGVFTASDLYLLRCVVVHAGSSSIDGRGAKYNPYRVIGVCIEGNPNAVIAKYGHRSIGTGGQQEECVFDCVVRLEALISCVAQACARLWRRTRLATVNTRAEALSTAAASSTSERCGGRRR